MEEFEVVKMRPKCKNNPPKHRRSGAFKRRSAPAYLAGDTESVDVLTSSRSLTEDDVKLVSEQIEDSWRMLGLRLGYSDETLENIEFCNSKQGSNQIALQMMKTWAQLPTATIGRLAITLWEMGKHKIAQQLPP